MADSCKFLPFCSTQRTAAPSPDNWFLYVLLAQKIKERKDVVYKFGYCVFQLPNSLYGVALAS